MGLLPFLDLLHTQAILYCWDKLLMVLYRARDSLYQETGYLVK